MIKRIFTTLALVMAFSTSAVADKAVLDVLVPSGKSGTSMAQALLLNKALIGAGYDSELVWTKNCPTTKEYLSSNTERPSVFLYSDSRYVRDKKKGCDYSISDETYAGLWNVKLHAFCVRADKGFTDMASFLKGKSSVTVATTNTLAPDMFAQINKQTGVEFKKVEYDGLKKTIAGLLAGDTDLMYQQYTKRQATNNEIKCFSSSAPVEVAGMTPMKDLFPNWYMNGWNSYQYIHANNMTASQAKAAGKAIMGLQVSNAKLTEFLKKGHMVSASVAEERGLGVDEFLASVELLRGKK